MTMLKVSKTALTIAAFLCLAQFSSACWAQEATSFDELLSSIERTEDAANQSNDTVTDSALPPSNDVEIRTDDFDSIASENAFSMDPGPSQRVQRQDPRLLAEQIRREAFDAALTGLLPLRPQEIRQLLEHFDETTRAVETPVYGTPTPEIAVQTVALDPGVAPPEINAAVGYVTTLNILDGTGAPWPIQDVTWAGDFEVVEPEEGGHILRITPLAEFAYGNISVRLLTLKTPVVFMLRTARDSVHYRIDVRVPENGPLAQVPIISGGGSQLSAGNPVLTNILDGVPPSSAVRLDVSGADGRTTAYQINDLTYVRTPLTLLSPGWESSASSADGMRVYALPQTPILLLSDQGKFIRARLSVDEGDF